MNLIIQKACTYFLIKTTVEKFIQRNIDRSLLFIAPRKKGISLYLPFYLFISLSLSSLSFDLSISFFLYLSLSRSIFLITFNLPLAGAFTEEKNLPCLFMT